MKLTEMFYDFSRSTLTMMSTLPCAEEKGSGIYGQALWEKYHWAQDRYILAIRLR